MVFSVEAPSRTGPAAMVKTDFELADHLLAGVRIPLWAPLSTRPMSSWQLFDFSAQCKKNKVGIPRRIVQADRVDTFDGDESNLVATCAALWDPLVQGRDDSIYQRFVRWADQRIESEFRQALLDSKTGAVVAWNVWFCAYALKEARQTSAFTKFDEMIPQNEAGRSQDARLRLEDLMLPTLACKTSTAPWAAIQEDASEPGKNFASINTEIMNYPEMPLKMAPQVVGEIYLATQALSYLGTFSQVEAIIEGLMNGSGNIKIDDLCRRGLP